MIRIMLRRLAANASPLIQTSPVGFSANINIENQLSISSNGIKHLNYKSILSLEVLP